MHAFEHELDRARDGGRLLTDAEVAEHGPERQLLERAHVVGHGHVLARLHGDAALEGLHDRTEVLGLHARAEHLEHGRFHDAIEHVLLAALLDRLDLDLARRARHDRVEVADARRDFLLAREQRAACGVGHERLVVRDRHAGRHARTLVDVR